MLSRVCACFGVCKRSRLLEAPSAGRSISIKFYQFHRILTHHGGLGARKARVVRPTDLVQIRSSQQKCCALQW
eukprot:6203872-Pleurochrysis_carterae.AAC.1